MLDAVSRIATVAGFHCPLDGVQRHVHTLVPDGVYCGLQTRKMDPPQELVEAVAGVDCDTD